MRYLCDVYVKVFLMQAHPNFTGLRIKCQMFPRLKPGNFWKWSSTGKNQGGITAIWETCEPRMTHIVISSKNEIYPEFQLWDASHQFEKRVNRQHGSILSHSFFSARLPQLPNLKSLFFAHFHWNFQSGSFQQKEVSLHFERNLSRWWWWTEATYSCCSIPGKTDNSKSAAIGWVLLGVSSGVGYMRQYTGIPVKTGGAKRQDML